MALKFGEKTALEITEIDRKGRGCGKVNNRRACAHFTIPGEEVEATLTGRRHGDLVLKVNTVTRPSPDRIEPRCPYAGKCGGCAWQQFAYPRQLEMKRGLVNAALAQGGIGRTVAVIPCSEQFYYRNRMDYCIGPKGELGLKEPGQWNAYLDLETCHLLSPESVQLMSAFRAYLKRNGVAPWDNRAYTGYARYLVIREGKNTGQRLATFVTADGPIPNQDDFLAALKPHASTIYHGINPTITDLSLAPQLELLHGDAFLTETVAGKTFFIHPNSFFQTNSLMAAKLLEKVAEFLGETKPRVLLDLYCGVGFFGISLADRAERVFGVEIDEFAIEMARKNAAANGIGNISFEAAKAESLIWEKEKPDTVIIDPPRAGLHPKVIQSLLRHLPETMVYVSCNYESFVRDFAALGQTYAIENMEALDLFPHSPHVELVTLLKRKSG